MIKFVEKQDEGRWGYGGERYYVPVYMVKDGQELFVRNRVVASRGLFAQCDISESQRKIDLIKKQLLENCGKFFKNNGEFDNPLDMLDKIAEKGWNFCKADDLYRDMRKENGCVDFHGNVKEYSYAFSYRIYDKDTMLAIMEKVAKIIERSKQNG